MIKNPPANAGDLRDMGSIPGSGRSPGEGHRNPLQNSGSYSPYGRKELDMTEVAWHACMWTLPGKVICSLGFIVSFS